MAETQPVKSFADMISRLKNREDRCRIAVAAAEDEPVLESLKRAHDEGIADYLLFGDEQKIRSISEKLGMTIDGDRIHHAPDHADAAARAVEAVREGKADVIMKGLLHTDVILKAVLNKEKGLRTGRLMSHVGVAETTTLGRLLFFSDAALNIAPTVDEKKDILFNTVTVARAFGIDCPKVAVLSAVETVKAAMPSSVDAAILSKMAERGQIKIPCIVDGPLAFDNAVSVEAAEHKGIKSPVAGKADVLVMPNIETGNVLWKAFVHLHHGNMAGFVVGARVPVVMTSRSDDAEAKFHSIAAAALASLG